MPTKPPTRPDTLTPPAPQEPTQTAPRRAAKATPPTNPTPTPHAPHGPYLTSEQVAVLLRPIQPSRVATMSAPGGGGRMSYVEAWDIRAHLNRIFGFGRWSADVVDLHLLYEDQAQSQAQGGSGSRPRWTCAYRATVRLTVNAPDGTVLATYTEAAAGSPMGPMPDRADAHDMAMKTAESQAFKRCAANLGTQFGLSLYDNGSTEDVVRRTLVGGEPEPA